MSEVYTSVENFLEASRATMDIRKKMDVEGGVSVVVEFDSPMLPPGNPLAVCAVIPDIEDRRAGLIAGIKEMIPPERYKIFGASTFDEGAEPEEVVEEAAPEVAEEPAEVIAHILDEVEEKIAEVEPAAEVEEAVAEEVVSEESKEASVFEDMSDDELKALGEKLGVDKRLGRKKLIAALEGAQNAIEE